MQLLHQWQCSKAEFKSPKVSFCKKWWSTRWYSCDVKVTVLCRQRGTLQLCTNFIVRNYVYDVIVLGYVVQLLDCVYSWVFFKREMVVS